ncbi:MAG TPA: SEC-C metal-binding domain-containing protein, partial [Nocardioides sp.]|nr:SEC-C metal-binding domain-containing protein [Nocardioides sp.]
VIYAERREVLEGADLEEQIRTFIDDVVTGFVTGSLLEFSEEWDLEQLWTDLGQIWPISLSYETLEKEAGGRGNLDRDELIEALKKDVHSAYDAREAEVGDEVMRELERRVLLSVLDRKWREHLYEMDYLREGIYLRAYSQRDPLVEYQREGFDMFAAMMDGIKEEAVGFLFNLEVAVDEEEEEEEVEEEVEEPMRREIPSAASVDSPLIRAKGLEAPSRPQNLSYSAPTEQGEVEVRGGTVTKSDDDPYANVGRNALCPCGSGKKYKKCHGAPGGPTGLTARSNG